MTSGRRRTSERSIGSGTPPSTRPFVPRRVAVLLFAALLAAFAAGIWGTVLRPAAYEVRGTIVARPAPDLVLVSHDAVRGLGMGAMELMAIAAEPALLDAVGPTPGDRVRLAVRATGDRLGLLRIERIP